MENRPIEISITPESVICMTIQGEMTRERLPLLEEDMKNASTFIREESTKASLPLPILIDLSSLSSSYDPSAMMMFASFEKENRPYVQKTLCFGESITVKFAGEIISALSERANIHFFDTKEDALLALSDAAPAK